VYDGDDCPRLAAKIRARGQSFSTVAAAQRAEHSDPEVYRPMKWTAVIFVALALALSFWLGRATAPVVE